MKNETGTEETTPSLPTPEPTQAATVQGLELSENQNIKKVREILFGKNINDYERRFLRLEEHLSNELGTTQKQNQALYANLEVYFKTEIKHLHQTLEKNEKDAQAEVRNLTDAIAKLRSGLSSFEQSSTEQFRKEYEQLVRKNNDLLEQLQREGKHRIDNVQSIEKEIGDIKSILIMQEAVISDLKKNLFQQLFDQGKLQEKRMEEERRERNSNREDLQKALDNLSERLIDFRTGADRRFDDITQKVSQHQAAVSSQLPETIRNLEARSNEATRTLKADLDAIFSRFNAFNSKTTDDFKELRELLHNQVKSLRLELEQQNHLVSQRLRTEQDIQRQKKVDRNALALLFSELAIKLGEDHEE